jgi:glycosyltransferase involved in cell wall biosynthesis
VERIFLVMNYFGIGGSERRFANYFNYIGSRWDGRTACVLNRGVYAHCVGAGLLRPGPHLVPLGLRDRLPFAFGPGARAWSALERLAVRRGLLRLFSGARDAAAYAIVGGVEFLPLLPCRRKVAAFVDPECAALDTPAWRALPPGVTVAASTERLAGVLRERARGRGWRILADPCSFIDYSRIAVRPKEPLAVFCARLSPEKQPGLFLDAAALVAARDARARFLMLGRGPLEAGLRERVRALGLEGRVEIGFSQDPPAVLGRSAVYAALQRTDNAHSQALLEAMASENAVVATDVGQTRDYVDQSCGVLVPGEAPALAEALGGLLADPQRCGALGRAARARATERHTVEGFHRHMDFLMGPGGAARPPAP